MPNEAPATSRTILAVIAASLLVVACATPARAQVTPAGGSPPPGDTPSIKLGTTIFTDYTYTQRPQSKDADGNTISPAAFNVSRAYLNVTGNISHVVGFRVTPDVFRETNPSSAANGSLVFRVKYVFAQINLDDWLPKGSWVRLGIQQTPFVDYEENIYPFRFQGTVFTEREGYLTSSDAGASFHLAFPANYGDVHVGLYNGEGYSKAEVNDQKAVQIRGTVRPLPRHPVLRGWRVTGFYDADNYVAHAARTRAIFNTTFEHRCFNAGFDYLHTHDRVSAAPASNPDVTGTGWAIFVTPRFGKGFEALLRYDRMRPDLDNLVSGGNGVNKRAIAGMSYWFPHQGGVSSAVLFDIENVTFSGFAAAKPTQQRLAVHALIAY